MLPKQRILIVDEEPFIRLTLREAVQSWSYEALEAGTFAAASKVFDEEEPNVVLLDIDLPDGSGLDLLTEFKVINYDFAKYGASDTRKRLLERWEKEIGQATK